MSTLGTVILVLVLLMLFGAFPTWGYNANWGYGPTGGVTILLIIVIVLLFTGRI